MGKGDTPNNTIADYTPVDSGHYIGSICVVLTHLIQQNEDFVLTPQIIQNCPAFTSPWAYDWASVEEYLNRLQEWIVCGPECFIVAMCILRRLEELSVVPPLNQRTFHRSFLTSLVIAVKYVEDETLSNSDFAKVGCVTVTELNEMERTACVALEFNCTVKPEVYEMMRADLNNLNTALRRKSKKDRPAVDVFVTFGSLCTNINTGATKKKTRFSFPKRQSSALKDIDLDAPIDASIQPGNRGSTRSFLRRASKTLLASRDDDSTLFKFNFSRPPSMKHNSQPKAVAIFRQDSLDYLNIQKL